MNDLQIFNYGKNEIRTVMIDGEPWFVLTDVCRVLDLSNPTAVAERLDEDERSKLSLGRQGQTWVISESGLYTVILRSDKPEAKPFRKWVTAEVLPSIRKNGGYLTPTASSKVLENLAVAVQLLTERLDAVMERSEEFSLIIPSSGNMIGQIGGVAARRRWLRTVSEKLNLLSNKLKQPHNVLLSQIYRILEENGDIVLEDNRLQVIEEYNLAECSILTAIFYNEIIRDRFQKIVDFNLAPENRGW